MRLKLTGAVAAMAILTLAAAPSAHHSQVAVYQSNAEQKIEGELVQVLIRSPHSWVHVQAPDDQGRPQRYAVEWGGAAQLRTAGIDGRTLKVGDKVKVTGRPGRNPADRRLLMMYIERPSDGWSWGNRPGEVVD
jgi:hypothetical protein